MTQQLSRLMDFIDRTRTASCAVRVTYESSSLMATVGRSEVESMTTQGVVFTDTLTDFIFTASDLQTEPAPGDHIVWDGKTYTVLATASAPCYQVVLSGKAIRVHTKIIGDGDDVTDTQSSASSQVTG